MNRLCSINANLLHTCYTNFNFMYYFSKFLNLVNLSLRLSFLIYNLGDYFFLLIYQKLRYFASKNFPPNLTDKARTHEKD